MATRKKEFICKCYFSRNVFLQKYKLHVSYHNEGQFYEDYRQNLRMKGCATSKQYEGVLEEIRKELLRRQNYHQDALQKHETILKTYDRLHPHLWDFKISYLDDRLLHIVEMLSQVSTKEDTERIILQNNGYILGKNLYRIPIFSTEFCEQLMQELSHFEASPSPKGRPNTMSNYGISLDEMGMSEGLLSPLISEYIQPLFSALFSERCDGQLDSFRAFSVLYGAGKDTELSMHFDNAEVTLNVCLSSQFEGGELEFGGLWNDEATHSDKETVTHKMGMGVLHLGQHTHRALPIVSGTRCNLIIWMRSSAVRNQLCMMCGSQPNLQEVPFAGDGFTIQDDHSAPELCSAL